MATKDSKSKGNSDATTNEVGQGVDTSVPSKMERSQLKTDENYQAATTGEVLDKNDGRLKENRESGTSLGTTAHSATAKTVERSGEAPESIVTD